MENRKKVKLDGKEIETKTKKDFSLLPNDCFAHVISFTGPRDACIFSLVSSSFQLAVDSDATWERLLPSDYASLLSRTEQPIQYASKKELYFRLCDHPVLIDGGKLSFGLKKSTGAKCFTIPAYEMNMPKYEDVDTRHLQKISYIYEINMSEFVDTNNYEFITLSNSRFSKGVKLTRDVYLGYNALFGRIESKILYPNTTYASYLIYRDYDRTEGQIFWSSISMNGLTNCQMVHLHYPRNPAEIAECSVRSQILYRRKYGPRRKILRKPVMKPKERTNGWMEVEMGQFYNENGEDGEVEINLHGFMNVIRSGTVFLGIEFRPRDRG